MFLFSLSRAMEKDRQDYLNTINRLPLPPIVIDGHMHIMSSHCTPLPLLWSRIGGFHLSTKTIDWAARLYLVRKVKKFELGEMGKIGQQSTLSIADDIEKTNYLIYSDSSMLTSYDSLVHGTELFSPMIGMPMDMDFAHYAGCEGHKIYYKVKEWDFVDIAVAAGEVISTIRVELPPRPEQVVTDNPLSKQSADRFLAIRQEYETMNSNQSAGSCTEVYRGTVKKSRYFVIELFKNDETGDFEEAFVWLDEDELTVYCPYRLQVRDIKHAALKHPWRHIPFYHFEPRRWAGKRRTFMDEIATERKAGMFLGVKMYPSLGFRPQGWADKGMKGLNDFYQECADKQIPILSHCSPGGMFTHERPLYFEKDKPASSTFEKAYKRAYEGEQKQKRFKQSWEEFYFSESYVSPANWEQVLKKFPKLRLCLAHFGGDEHGFSCWGDNAKKESSFSRELALWDEIMIRLVKQYDNCYIDISYFSVPDNLEKFKSIMDADSDDKVKNKILFGTDSYLIEAKWRYGDYCARALKALNEIDETLWPRFTCLNPLKYFRLEKVADNLAAGMKRELQKMSETTLAETGIDKDKSTQQIDEYLKIFRKIDTDKYARSIHYPV